MSIIDAKNVLGTAQAVTVAAATTDILDLGAPGKDAFGNSQVHDKFTGRQLFLNMVVTASATAAGAATMQLSLEGADDSGFSTNKVVYLLSDNIPKASLVAGAKFRFPIPGNYRKRYLRGYFTIGTGPLTAGNFTTFIDHD